MTVVVRAVQAHKRALAQLINLSKHPDEAIRSEAADALKRLDPPPTWPLGEALLGSRDTDFRLRIIKVPILVEDVLHRTLKRRGNACPWKFQ